MPTNREIKSGLTRNNQLLTSFKAELPKATGVKKALLEKRISGLQNEISTTNVQVKNRNTARPDLAPGGTPAQNPDVLKLFDDYTNYYDYFYNKLTPEQRTAIQGDWEKQAKAEVDPFYDEQKKRLDSTNQINTDRITNTKTSLDTSKDQTLADFDTQNSRLADDYTRFTGYAKDDYAKNLAQVNKGFAKTLTNAAIGFGQRGVDASGIQASYNQEQREGLRTTQDQLLTTEKRAIEGAGITEGRGMQDVENSKNSFLGKYDVAVTDNSLAQKSQDNSYSQDAADLDQSRKYAEATATNFNMDNYFKKFTSDELGRLNLKAGPVSSSYQK